MDLNLVSFIQLSDILKLAVKYLDKASSIIEESIQDITTEINEKPRNKHNKEKIRQEKKQIQEIHEIHEIIENKDNSDTTEHKEIKEKSSRKSKKSTNKIKKKTGYQLFYDEWILKTKKNPEKKSMQIFRIYSSRSFKNNI